MGIYINVPTPTFKDAQKFSREHTVIAKKDLRRIRALAKKHGLLKELKALGVTVRDLDVHKDPL